MSERGWGMGGTIKIYLLLSYYRLLKTDKECLDTSKVHNFSLHGAELIYSEKYLLKATMVGVCMGKLRASKFTSRAGIQLILLLLLFINAYNSL